LKKKFSVFDLGFSVDDITIEACFRLFGQFYLALGVNPTGYFWLMFFLETTLKSMSLEPLIDFLPYSIWSQNYDQKN